MKVSGTRGRLLHGYQQAATIDRWSLVAPERPDQPATVKARLEAVDEFWFDRRPLDLVLSVADVEWTWRGVTVVRDGRVLQVEVVGRPESERYAQQPQ